MPKTIPCFFYGLYMDRRLLASVGVETDSFCKAKVVGYRLDLHGVAKLLPAPGDEVWGMLIELPEDEFEALYSATATRMYRRGEIDVITEDGQTLRVCLYNAPAEAAGDIEQDYLEKLIQLAQLNDFPESYQQRLQAMRA